MPVHKQIYKSGEEVWYFEFNLPGSTREERVRVSESGFKKKQEAIYREADRRKEEKEKRERAAAGSTVVAPLPKTLSELLAEWFREHVHVKLAPKTRERYVEQGAMLSRELLEMALPDIKPMHLTREWNRLLKSGGRHRKTKDPRPLGKKTVSNVAGVLSSAFKFAIKSDMLKANPVIGSDPPVPRKPKGIGLSMQHVDLLVVAASGPWCMGMFLELCYALGARRGEVLALRWTDIRDGRATISRSLCQTKQDGLQFKSLKGAEETEAFRVMAIPEETLVKLEAHRKRQEQFRQQFIETYRTDLDLIFCNENGTLLKPDSISASVSALFKRLKVQKPKGGSVHLLRHTLASQLLDAGVGLPAVSARLGHSSIRTTSEIYSHMIHGADDETVRKLEEYQKRKRATGGQPQPPASIQ
jgi:integrase